MRTARTVGRKFTMAAAGLLGAAALLVTNTVAAQAADYTNITFKMYPGKQSTIIIYADGHQAGRVNWVADPFGGAPGEYLCAVDDRSDGYYVKGILTTGRTVSTNGKPSPGADCQGGNLPEDRGYGLKACLENHYVRACSINYYVHS
ncbi:hypothetical protein EOT10_15820 [Streptomyces antnestii]|uniref:Uncharacterized protein n=1 Tax=Streptomyces antnestii TaxID=2494256 RepID=A0A3S2XVA6_9ACTN|nr:hypothetical protein [Streptomyces sp. San01]RVU24471.1 hypothetical protein EOT10_15820 [Streptomyces sp. San01]